MRKQRKWKIRRKRIVFLLTVGLLSFSSPSETVRLSLINCCYAAEVQSPGEYEEIIGKIIEKSNEERARNGLGLLVEDLTLSKAATLRAYEQTEKFAHIRPDGSPFYTVFSQFGILGAWRGENLARAGAGNSDSVMTAWMDSEGHRKNILNSNFTRIGVGYVEVKGVGYWCQLFAS